jgi:hypothetical protein
LAFLALFYTKNKITSHHDKKIDPKHHYERYLKLTYDACHNNNARNTNKALINWARGYFQQPMLSGIAQIIEQINDEHLIQALYNLESVQYSIEKQHWEGQQLCSALEHFIQKNKNKKKKTTTDKQVLVELNP